MIIKYGSSRMVFLTTKFAFKIPRVDRWKCFLYGLLANMNEVKFNSLGDNRLAKINMYIPYGLLVVMDRATELTHFDEEELTNFYINGSIILPVEIKKDSFGIIDGELKAIDYG